MLKTRDFSYYHNSWKFRGDEVLPCTQIDMVIERADALQNKYYLEEIEELKVKDNKLKFTDGSKKPVFKSQH